MSKMIKVVATARGYFGQLIEEGQMFEVPEGTQIGRWMKLFEEKEDKGAKPAPARRKRKASKAIPDNAETLTEAMEGTPTDDWQL